MSILDSLQALIDHPNTKEGERDAARHALARLQAKQQQKAPSEPVAYRFEGAKFRETAHLSPKKLGALIRGEIKAIRKAAAKLDPGDSDVAEVDPIGTLPTGAKVSVRTENTETPVITMTVRALTGERWWRWARGYVLTGGVRSEYRHGTYWPLSPVHEVGAALKELANQYGFDDSDSQIDHFHQRFYTHVEVETPDGRRMSIGHPRSLESDVGRWIEDD